MVYFDARLSEKYPTVEVRVADVAQDVRHSVLVAGLTRALVDTAVAEWRDGRPPPETPAVVLRAATWRASRFGLGDDLVDPVTDQLAPADRVVANLVDLLGPALSANGDLDLVGEAVDRLLTAGTGADQQRRAHARRGSLATSSARRSRPPSAPLTPRHTPQVWCRSVGVGDQQTSPRWFRTLQAA